MGTEMALQEVELRLACERLPQELEVWIDAARERIQQYWDQFPQKPLPQYIECDFDYVARALQECIQRELPDGKLFCEWGCGFGIVTGLAALLGLDAVGIEAEEFLCQQARKLLLKNRVKAEIWCGNFLPGGARDLAFDEDPLVSLTHRIEPAYEQYDMRISDFAFIFVYPWPDEEHFLRAVFDRYARVGALLLMYRGPYHVEVFRKKFHR